VFQTELLRVKETELDYRDLPSVTVFVVAPVTRSMVTGFIEKWHYSHNVNGITDEYCFALYYENNMIGAAMFGKPATPGVAEAYNNGGVLTELRRLCCIDNTPRNTESYFIGQMLKWLRLNTDVSVILSYADTTYGHEGTIYKATNFELVGQSSQTPVIEYKGKTYHKRLLHQKRRVFQKEIIAALEAGEAKWIKTKPKNIYIMHLRKTALLSNTRVQLTSGTVRQKEMFLNE